MGNVFTLDSLREEVEKEFAPVEIVLPTGAQVTLRNLLRLPKKEREVVLGKLKELDAAENAEGDSFGDVAAVALQVLEVVADEGKALVKELGDDVALTLKVLNVWMGSSQAGEAVSSPAS